MSEAHNTYWISWYIRDIDDERVAERWPDDIRVWRTGETMEEPPRATLCARIEAGSEDEAWNRVRSLYGPYAHEVVERFSEQVPRGWWPPEDRFPRSAR